MADTIYDAVEDFGVFYDEIPLYAARTDFMFYVAEAERAPGSGVLELGCGTGRVLLPIARAGHAITGIDSSSSMLARCREKLAEESSAVRERVVLCQEDVRDFDVPRRDVSGFALAIAPFRVLQHLATIPEQLQCLAAVREVLAPGGRFAFDVFNPSFPMMTKDRTTEVEDTPEHELVDGRFLRRTVRVTAVRWVEQLSNIELAYYIRSGDQTQRVVQAFAMRWYGPAEIESLLARAGFRVEAMYGNFDRTPLRDDSPEIITVAVRTD